MKRFILIFFILNACYCGTHLIEQRPIVAEQIPTSMDLLCALKTDDEIYKTVSVNINEGDTVAALKNLVDYFKENSARRYYFSWKNFKNRFKTYRLVYADQFETHAKLTDYHMNTYFPETQWKLPFMNIQGKDVTAYELRHLARQQKSFDMVMMYYLQNEDYRYLDYYTRQVRSLNRAFMRGAYDDKGNGIYESYRGGRRVHYWLFCYNAYLASENFQWEDQLLLVRTFLHHGAQLAERTRRYQPGNHHTKGLVSLFEISCLFPEFRITTKWRSQAIDGLVKHLKGEVNSDGFQFERSVHYHKGDIDNYFRVYQLAEINDIDLPDFFQTQFRMMFEALVNISQPNRRAPVLQDDTDKPGRINNRLDDVMALGSILFKDAAYKYFTDGDIAASQYWYMREEQLRQFEKMEVVFPDVSSIALESTGYYVMRSGWDYNDMHMVISAGLSKEKPDHQHGEALSVTAYAHGHEVLPNYQVFYNDPNYLYFKSSWVKNIALVDSLELGRRWKSNKGRSGFGKWMILPESEVLKWETHENIDYFSGSHNGFDTLGVTYRRDVTFLKDSCWIVEDHFETNDEHLYQQIWQGDYRILDEKHVVNQFEDGSGLEIEILSDGDFNIKLEKKDSHKCVIFESLHKGDFIMKVSLRPFIAPLKN